MVITTNTQAPVVVRLWTLVFFFPLVWPTFVDFGRTFFVVFARLDLYSFRNIFNWTRTSCSDKLLWLICVCGAAQSGMHIGPLPFTRRGLEGRA